MNPFQRFNAIAFAWYVLAIGGLAACSTSDPSAGTPYPGGSSSPPTPPPEQAALRVRSSPSPIRCRERAYGHNAPDKDCLQSRHFERRCGSRFGNLKDVTTSPRPLFGPIGNPTIHLAPFRRNVYYEARGFELQPSTTYQVEVASIESNCKPDPISGAIFKTKALTLRPALVTVGGLSRSDFRAVVGVIIEHSGGAASLNENLPIR